MCRKPGGGPPSTLRDGALTGGLAYEGLNDAGASGEPLVVILNDNFYVSRACYPFQNQGRFTSARLRRLLLTAGKYV